MQEKIIEWLKKKILQIDELEKEGRKSVNFDAWKTSTSRLLERISWKDSSYVENFQKNRYSLGAFVIWWTPDYEFENAYLKWLKKAREILKSIVEELEEYWIPENSHKWENQEKWNKTEVTVNLNQTIKINLKTVLENNLTVKQYKELDKILEIQDEKEKKSQLSNFLVSVWVGWMVEILKAILTSSF